MERINERDQARTHTIPPWEIPPIRVQWNETQSRKKDTAVEEMQSEFRRRLDHMKKGVTVYTDGSVLSNGRSGVGIAGYKKGREVFGNSIRLSDGCSSTMTEVFGILAGISLGKRHSKNIIIVCDSKSAMHSLTSKKSKYKLHVWRILQLISGINKAGGSVEFLWAPSHIGIRGNERADRLAREGARLPEVEYRIPVPITAIKKRAGYSVEQEEIRKREQSTSMTLQGYLALYGCGGPTSYTAMGLLKRRLQTTYSRIRMGHKYFWELGVRPRDGKPQNTKCRSYFQEGGHTLKHYLQECRTIAWFREMKKDEHSYREHFLRPEILMLTLEKTRGFAPPR